MKLELIPLLIVVLLMLSAGGAEVETAELLIEGDHEIEEHRGALIVGDATVTIPEGETVSGPIYVIGGELRIRGAVTGDVTQLSGSLVAEDGAMIEGELQHIAGDQELSDTAAIAILTTVEPTATDSGPVASFLPLAVATLGLAIAGGWLSRTRPSLLENVGDAVSDHPVISVTVGGLLSVTFLSVFVFMAFTLVLIPVSILGLLVGVLAVAYGVVALGYLLGQRLESSLLERRLGTSRPGVATGIGVIAVMTLLEVLGFVPLVGDLVALALLVAGLGAVVLTYFGLAPFEPVALPD